MWITIIKLIAQKLIKQNEENSSSPETTHFLPDFPFLLESHEKASPEAEKLVFKKKNTNCAKDCAVHLIV